MIVRFSDPATHAEIPANLRKAVAAMDGRAGDLGAALASLRKAAGLRFPDPRGDIQDVPPVVADLFGDAVESGEIVYRKGRNLDGLRWRLVRYSPVGPEPIPPDSRVGTGRQGVLSLS